MSNPRYGDLFDLERRPGAGVQLWGDVTAMQRRRVLRASDFHRLHHQPGGEQNGRYPEAESQLHADVYFLALAIRRVLRFHEAISARVSDERLRTARDQFVAAVPEAKDFRDFYEHLDEYLLGAGRRQARGEVIGRISPILRLRWDSREVSVQFGSAVMDITGAASSAVTLAESTYRVWADHMEKLRPDVSEPPDDGVKRAVELTFSISTIIGGSDEAIPEVRTGAFQEMVIRDAEPGEFDDD